MSERGTFIVDRGIFTHPVFADEPFTEREAWQWLIAEAAYKPHERRIGRARVKLARGQLAHSTRFMAEAWKWSARSVRRFLAKIAAEGMIVATDAPQVTQITICNYDDYQAPATKHAPDVPQTRPKLEEKEESKKEREGDARAREAPSSISPEAHELAREFLIAIGVDPQNPELAGMAGAPWSAQLWLTRGYERALVLATAADKARDGPKPLTWWNRVMESTHNRRPIPSQRSLPLLQTVENPNAPARRSPATTWQQSRDDWREMRAELKAGIAAAEQALAGSDESRGPPARPIAAVGHERPTGLHGDGWDHLRKVSG